MRKISILLALILAMALQFCSSTKNAVKEVPKITYQANIQQVMSANCQPCHFPPKGRLKAYNTYVVVSGDIDEIIRRISLQPNEPGFMPLKHPRLPDSTIQKFVQFKTDGKLEM